MWSRVRVMAMRGRGLGRGGGRGGRGGGRHPPSLKGKEIGLFYKNKSLQKRKQIEKSQRAVVGINQTTEGHLNYLLHEAKKEQVYNSEPTTSMSESILKRDSLPSRGRLIQNGTLDAQLQKEFLGNHEDKHTSYHKLQEFRQTLPCYDMREEILSKIYTNQVIVLVGETGCGKTTQIPQYILDDAIAKGCGSTAHIVCTQPRRISAISVAARVSEERGENPNILGGAVGHQIRLESRQPRPYGSILYCTTGVMLRWLINSPTLEHCSHIVLDEVHERDVLVDFLMIILRDVLPKRPDLKLIIMSATLHAELLSQYFYNCPIVKVPGRVFPVTINHLEDFLPEMRYKPKPSSLQLKRRGKKQWMKADQERVEFHKYLSTLPAPQQEALSEFSFSEVDCDLILHTIKHIHRTAKEGAILVFLPGWTDISLVNDMIMKDPVLSAQRVIPLHSMLPTASQKEVFNPPPKGVRKIVLATNIAETSITIDDVVYVVDSGKVKETTYDVSRNITCLDPVWISQASAKQRQGRAGRVQPGQCYRLYTRYHYDQMSEYQLPEILRKPLEELVLQVKILKLGRVVPFLAKALQPPKEGSVVTAVRKLTYLQALDSHEELTALGYHLAMLPVNPSIGKAILFGAILSCLDPVLTVCAALGFKDPFVVPLSKQREADAARKEFAGDSRSDHVATYKAFQEWDKSDNKRSFCWKNFLSHNTMEMLKRNKRQFAELLMEIGFISSPDPNDPTSNTNSSNLQLTKAILCAGLYPNVAKIVPLGGAYKKQRPPKFYTETDGRVYIHPKSVNISQSNYSSKHVIYHTKVKSTKIFLHDCTMVTPFPLLFFGGDITTSRDEDQEIVKVDRLITFQASASIAHLVKDLKAQLNSLLEQKIASPSLEFSATPHGSKLIQAIIDLICNEDTSQFSQSDDQDQQYYADDQHDDDYPADQEYYQGHEHYQGQDYDQGYYVDHSHHPSYNSGYSGYHPDHNERYYYQSQDPHHQGHSQKYQAYRPGRDKSTQDFYHDQSKASNYSQGYRSDHKRRYFQDQGSYPSSSSGHHKGNKYDQDGDDYWKHT